MIRSHPMTHRSSRPDFTPLSQVRTMHSSLSLSQSLPLCSKSPFSRAQRDISLVQCITPKSLAMFTVLLRAPNTVVDGTSCVILSPPIYSLSPPARSRSFLPRSLHLACGPVPSPSRSALSILSLRLIIIPHCLCHLFLRASSAHASTDCRRTVALG